MREHQRPIVVLDRCAEIHGRSTRRDRAIGQVLPRAERAARAGEQQHARIAVSRDPRQRVAQLGMHLGGEAVQPVRPVQRDARDAVTGFEADLLVVHRPAPRVCRAFLRAAIR